MSVRYLMVKTSLETKCHRPGGKRVKQALADAWTNLEILAPETLRLIDAGLEEIATLCAGAGETRPDNASLQRMFTLSDELAGYCAIVNLPGMDKALVRMCQLTDAVINSTYWRPETFGPTLTVLRLVRHQAMNPEDINTLFEGIDSCTEKYLEHRIDDPSDDPSGNQTTH